MKSPLFLPVLGLVGALSASSAWAQTEAVSNLGNLRYGGNQVLPGRSEAMRFTTGTSVEGLFRLFSVVIEARNTPTTPGTGFAFNLYSDNANPDGGSLIATLAGSDPTGTSFADYTFSAPADTFLAASTSYWLVASAASGEFQWAITSDHSQTDPTTAGWSIDDNHGVSDSWTIEPDPLKFSVNISPVPEPSSYAAGLLLVGAVGGVWWRQRRSR